MLGCRALSHTPVSTSNCICLPLIVIIIVILLCRPFCFAVVHAPSGLALFSGEVHRPETWKGYER